MTITKDAFLGGRLQILQPLKGYRAGTDPVLLAAACPAMPGQSVLDLGCGVGTASLCLLARVNDVDVTGLELQADYAALARQNAGTLPFNVIEGDVASPPPNLRARSFDHVMCNPPYFGSDTGSNADDPGRDTALREDTALSVWIDQGIRRLAPKGTLTMILRTDRMLDSLSTLDQRVGALKVLPIASRANRSAHRFLFQVKKGARAAPQILPPFVMHDGLQHIEDCDDYSDGARAVLRDGASINWDAA